jgi:ferredoxin
MHCTDDLPFPSQAEVNPSLCVSCGICAALSSSTPFRRSEDLKTVSICPITR